MESKHVYVILLRNSISEKIFIIIPREMSEAFKICCSIRQRKSPKRCPSFAQTFRNSLVLTRRDSFVERTFEQKYVRAMLFHLYLQFCSVSCKVNAKHVLSQHLDKLRLKETKKWRSLIVFRRDGVSWTRNPYLFIRETIYRRRITRDFFALPLPTRNSPSCNSGKINDDRDE